MRALAARALRLCAVPRVLALRDSSPFRIAWALAPDHSSHYPIGRALARLDLMLGLIAWAPGTHQMSAVPIA